MHTKLLIQANAAARGHLSKLSTLLGGCLLLILSGCNAANEHLGEESMANVEAQQAEVTEQQAAETNNDQPAQVIKSSTREEPVAPQIEQGEHTLVKPIDKPWPPQPDPKPVLEEKPKKDSI